MPNRDGAIARAHAFFDDGGFQDLLARLVAILKNESPAEFVLLPLKGIAAKSN